MFSFGKWFKSSKAYWPTPTRWATFASFPLIPIIIIHILLLYNLRYTAWPENFLWPYLNLHGLSLYKDIFYIYPPLYSWVLTTWDKILGVNLNSLMLLNYLIIAITDFLLFKVSKTAKAVFVYIPLQIYFEGNSLWPDLLLAPLFLSIYLAWQQKKFWVIGIISALALLTKQTAGYFVSAIMAALVLTKVKSFNIAKVFTGLILIFVGLNFWLLFSGNLSNFYEETIKYVLGYHAGNAIETLWPTKYQLAVVLLVYLPAIFLGILKRKYLLVILTITASLGVFTRFEYFHLQPALPFLAILIAQNLRPTFIFYLAFLIIFFKMLIRDFHQPPRFLTPDFYQNAKIINSYVHPGEKTLFIATWDHYYYLTATLPAGNFFASSTPWNLNYSGIQEKYIDGIKKDHPQYIFLGTCLWEKGICYQPKKIQQYVRSNYTKISELPDGTGVFKNNPVSLGKKL